MVDLPSSKASIRALIFAIVALLAGCAHTTPEVADTLCPNLQQAPCSFNPAAGYRFNPEKNPGRETLVIVTMSGGGVRAAALAYGTLLALQQIPVNGGANLLQQVDIMSSVSGGSVAAGWYAANGAGGLKPGNDLERFLHSDNMTALALRGLNPGALTAYVATRYQRSDVLAAYFTRRLFSRGGRKLTYTDVLDRYQNDRTQPYVILNATDFGHETRFPFTQGRFDLLCSELSVYPLGYAVAASANFPLIFSPIGIENHSLNCPQDSNWEKSGPPNWINSYSVFDAQALQTSADQANRTKDCPGANGLLPLQGQSGQAAKPISSIELLEVRTAREARAYLQACSDDRYVHLLDGGLVDNLGVASTLEIEDRPGLEPGLYQRFTQAVPGKNMSGLSWPERYRNVKQILYVVVNARSRTDFSPDARIYPPGFFNSLLRVIDTPLDATILDSQNYLTAELESIVEEAERADSPRQPGSNVTPGAMQNANMVANGSTRRIRFNIVSVDFEAIPDPDCRAAFWRTPTSWTLQPATVNALAQLPEIILGRSSELMDFHNNTNAPPMPAFPGDFGQICAAVSSDYPK